MMKFLLSLVIFTALMFADSAWAQRTFTYSGELSADSLQYQRLEEDCETLSANNVAFSALPIRVEVPGEYTITSDQDGFDGVLFIYDAFFNPEDPVPGCLAANDDNGGVITNSRVENIFLQPDENYLIVVASFNPNDLGNFTNTIEGPGRSGRAIGGEMFAGTTVDGRRITRPVDGCMVDPNFVAANNTPYDLQVLSVSTSADYSFFSEQTGFDGVLMVYDETFNPIDPERGCLAVNDDAAGGVGRSEIIDLPLIAGRTYYIVTTGFENTDSGNYITEVTGPGAMFTEPGVFSLSSLTGGWFDPGLDGSGFNIVAADVGIIFTFYGYINGEQRWLLSNVLPNDIKVGQAVFADVRIGDGGQLNDPGAANVVTFGQLIFQLLDCRNAIAVIQGEGEFSGTDQFFNLRRLVQGTGLDCSQ